jgi:hypothetical protein
MSKDFPSNIPYYARRLRTALGSRPAKKNYAKTEAVCYWTLHSWTKWQKPAKKKFKKFVKSTDHTCACNDLTSFEYKTHSQKT